MYHMFGATVGALHVYFKRETNGVPQLMFSKEGDQGNQWLHGIFNFPKSDQNFQIIIEGVRGSSYVSDIAVDDVAILQGDKCNADKTEVAGVTQSDEDQIEVVNAQQSCRGRCKNILTHFTTVIPLLLSDACLCTLDCAEHSICCPDYAEYCVLGITEEIGTSTEATNHETTLVPEPPTRKESDIVTVRPNYFDRDIISINPKDDIDPITSKPPAFTTISPVTRLRTVIPLKTTALPVVPTMEVHTKETPFVVPTTTTSTTTTVARRYVHHDDKPDSSTSIDDPKKLPQESAKVSLPGVIGIVAGIITGISITMLVAIVIVRKRKTCKRGANGSALSEDSDVRFLTSDEMLDFTLARPSDNDES